MITRMRRGWTSANDADDYERFLLDELFPSMREIRGFCGAQVLRRPDEGEVAFVVLTCFGAMEQIEAFAGADPGRPVIEPRAATLLIRRDEHALHYETSLFEA